MNCTSEKNFIYMIECSKETCKKKPLYRGNLTRISQHLGYINTKKLDQPTGKHFNEPGHSKANLKATILEKVKVNDLQNRKEREHYHIQKFLSFYRGLNLKP